MSQSTLKVSKLSSVQKNVLRWLWTETQRVEAREAKHPPQGAAYRVGVWGVRWGNEGVTRAQAATLSRAVARLEARDLVIRQNIHTGSPGSGEARTESTSMPPRRCTSVLLTPKGRLIAQQLEERETVNISPELNVNRFESVKSEAEVL